MECIPLHYDESGKGSRCRSRSILATLTRADKWILSKVNTLAKEVTENLDKYELGIAVQKVYDFIWEEFCDWYIEMVKPRLYSDDGYDKGSSTLDTEDGS